MGSTSKHPVQMKKEVRLKLNLQIVLLGFCGLYLVDYRFSLRGAYDLT